MCVFCFPPAQVKGTPSKKPKEETEAQRRRREQREAEEKAIRKWWEEDLELEEGQKWKVRLVEHKEWHPFLLP